MRHDRWTKYPGQHFRSSLISLSRELHSSIAGVLDLARRYEHAFRSWDRLSRLSALSPTLMLSDRLHPILKWSEALETTAWSIIRSSSFVTAVERFNQTWTRVLEFLKECDRASGILVELGWPPHQDLGTGELAEIARIYDAEGPERTARIVHEFMVTRYKGKALERILERWGERRWLRPRFTILEQIVAGHRHGLYFLTVPVGFAQVEGIIAEGFGHQGIMKKEHYTNYLEQLLDEPRSEHRAMKNFLLNVVLQRFVWGMQEASEFSRHAILHGYDTRYGTEQHSLKVILLFDYIQAKFGYVSVGKGRSYHDLSCPVVRGKPRRAVFESEEEAREAGRRPCGRCIRKAKAA